MLYVQNYAFLKPCSARSWHDKLGTVRSWYEEIRVNDLTYGVLTLTGAMVPGPDMMDVLDMATIPTWQSRKILTFKISKAFHSFGKTGGFWQVRCLSNRLMVFGENKQKRHNCNRCGDPIKNHIVKIFIGRKVGGIWQWNLQAIKSSTLVLGIVWK